MFNFKKSSFIEKQEFSGIFIYFFVNIIEINKQFGKTPYAILTITKAKPFIFLEA